MTINFSNDLGYSAIKGRINGDLIKVPSEVVVQQPENISDPVNFNRNADKRNYLKHYLNHMDVIIDSPEVKESKRMLVGSSVDDSAEQPVTFDVNDMAGKSQSDLSIIMTLATIAGKALSIHYLKHDNLPKKGLDVTVNMVTALPILEGTRNNTLSRYADRYTGHDHTVTIKNFSFPIPVHIHFAHVLVRLEGQVAVYDIRHGSDKMKDSLIDDFRSHYPKLYSMIQHPTELTANANTLSIDIGEGTTDFAVFNNGKVNISASSSIQMGYGNVLESASKEMKEEGYSVNSRADVKDILEQKPDFSNAPVKRDCQKAIDDNKQAFNQQIVAGTSSAIHDARGRVNVIYVYGGGAIPMESTLRKQLMQKTHAFRGGHDIPVVFITKPYAQYMNVDGLELIINALNAFLKAKQNKQDSDNQ